MPTNAVLSEEKVFGAKEAIKESEDIFCPEEALVKI